MADTSAPTSPGPRSECLSEGEVSRLRQASSEEVPEDVARHLASCEWCQERVLFGPGRRPRRRRESLPMPSSTRALVLLAVMAAVMVAFFITLQSLLGRL